jgi:MFS family permease
MELANSGHVGAPTYALTQSVPVVVVGGPSQIRAYADWVLLYQAVNLLFFVQTLALVGAGATSQSATVLLGDFTIASWLILIFPIISISVGLPLSHVSDYWSRKWMIVVPSIIAIAGLVIISRAQDIATLVAGFCIAGLSFATQPLLYTVVSEALPRRLWAVAQSTMAVSYGIGGMLAFIIGGHLLRDGDPTKYRIFWYIIIALQVASVTIVVLVYQPTPLHHESQPSSTARLKMLPWLNYFLFTGALTLLIVGLMWSQNG